MVSQQKALQQKIAKLEEQLKDAHGRLPAHSVKPPLMHEIFSLEEELEELKSQMKKVNRNNEEI